jgi:6-pyruvoyltetrahydropterin/6-carboxytetrahydropterin synthase
MYFRDFRDFDTCRERERTMSGTFTLSVQCRLAASHVLPGCPPCDRLHGHTWTVRAFWTFAGLDASGMGANFRDLKEALREQVRARYDHRHLNDIPPFDTSPPTAENLAREVFRVLASQVDTGPNGHLARVEVWEGPESCAAYEE